MPTLGLLLIVGIAVAAVLRAPLRMAFAVTVGVLLLIPGFLAVPNPLTSNVTCGRVLLAAFLLRLVIDIRHGVVPADVLRPDRVLLSLSTFAVLAMVLGVVLADVRVPFVASSFRWWQIADYVLVYAAALAGFRAIEDLRWIARVLTAIAVTLAGIALLERFIITGGYARWWYGARAGAGAFGSGALELRGGERVRASAAFALEFGWVCALLTPLVVSVVATSRSIAARLAPATLAGAAVWTVSRSGLAALGAGLLLIVVLSRFEAGLTRYVAALAVGALVVFVFVPAVSSEFRETRETQRASTQARANRWPEAAAVTADSPVTGRGLGALKPFGIESVDNSYLLTYVEMGVIGLAAFVCVLAVALLTVVRALRAPPDAERRRLTAAVATVPILALVGASAYDLFELPLSQAIVWIAVAMCAVHVEQHPRPARARVAPASRIAIVAAAVLIGLGVRAGSSSSASSRYAFETLPTRVIDQATGSVVVTGTVLAETACDVVDVAAEQLNDARFRCRVDGRSQGLGDLWLQTPDAASTAAAADAIADRVRAFLPAFQMRQSEPMSEGRPTLAETAPLWLPLVATWLTVALTPGRLPPPVARGASAATGSDLGPRRRRSLL